MSDIPQDVFCELRIGTLLNASQIKVDALDPSQTIDNSWHPSHIRVNRNRPSVYHPVKHFEHL